VFQKKSELFHGQINETVFNEWLVHHYANYSRDVLPHTDLESIYLDAIEQASLGIYGVRQDKKYLIFENILTKRQFHVPVEAVDSVIDEQCLYLTRIYTIRGAHICGSFERQLPVSARSILLKEIMGKYQEAKIATTYTIDGFIQETPLLLYWAADVIEDVIPTIPEEEFAVFEMHAIIAEVNQFEEFLKSKRVKPSEFEGVYTLEAFSEVESAPIDFVIEGEKVIFECAHEAQAEELKNQLEENGWGLVAVGVHVVTLEELYES